VGFSISGRGGVKNTLLARRLANVLVATSHAVLLALRQADRNVDRQCLEALGLNQEFGEGLGGGGTIEPAVTKHNDHAAALYDIGGCDEGHGDTVAELGIRN